MKSNHAILLRLVIPRGGTCKSTFEVNLRSFRKSTVQINGKLQKQRKECHKAPLGPLLPIFLLKMKLDNRTGKKKRDHRYVRYADDFSNLLAK